MFKSVIKSSSYLLKLCSFPAQMWMTKGKRHYIFPGLCHFCNAMCKFAWAMSNQTMKRDIYVAFLNANNLEWFDPTRFEHSHLYLSEIAHGRNPAHGEVHVLRWPWCHICLLWRHSGPFLNLPQMTNICTNGKTKRYVILKMWLK